jgi:hypothetical protein
MKDGRGMGGGMGEELLYALACVNLAVVAGLAIDRYRTRWAVDERLNDLSDAATAIAQELLARTEQLMDLKKYMPDISLINQSPFEGMMEFFRMIRGDKNPDENFTTPARGDAGRWIDAPTQEADPTPRPQENEPD